MKIEISKTKQAPAADIVEIKKDEPNCKEDNPEGILRKDICNVHFTGNTNRSGQILIFKNESFVDVLERNIEYIVATVTDKESKVENAILDSNIKYATQSTGVDTGSTYIISANIHATTADKSKEASINWP